MPTHQERAALARDKKLAAIQERVRDGSLTIRAMTPAERERYPKVGSPRRPRGRR